MESESESESKKLKLKFLIVILSQGELNQGQNQRDVQIFEIFLKLVFGAWKILNEICYLRPKPNISLGLKH